MKYSSTNNQTIVLLVDETVVILKSIEMILCKDGYHVYTVQGSHYPSEIKPKGPKDSLGVIRYIREEVSPQTEILLVSTIKE